MIFYIRDEEAGEKVGGGGGSSFLFQGFTVNRLVIVDAISENPSVVLKPTFTNTLKISRRYPL
jgi:hypothetical protein